MTAKQWRVYREYVEHYGLRPLLSVPSANQFHFLNQEGRSVVISMGAMEEAVKQWRAEDKQP